MSKARLPTFTIPDRPALSAYPDQVEAHVQSCGDRIAWSAWRRRHQARARQAHQRWHILAGITP